MSLVTGITAELNFRNICWSRMRWRRILYTRPICTVVTRCWNPVSWRRRHSKYCLHPHDTRSIVVVGHVEGRSFPRAFERREKFIYLRKFLLGIWEIYKKCLVNWRVGEPGGGSFSRTFERKKECVSALLFLGPRGYYNLSLAAIWKFNREQGSPKLISDYGAQRARL
jgi:hypothetical protein